MRVRVVLVAVTWTIRVAVLVALLWYTGADRTFEYEESGDPPQEAFFYTVVWPGSGLLG